MLTIKTTGIEDYLDPAGGGAWVQALIIGGHGVGKTPFAAKWPKPIFAMAEHGTMSIAKDKLPYGEIHTDKDMDAFILEIRKDCALPLDKRKYLTVVVDTIDSYQKRLMDHRVVTQQLERFTGWDNWDWLDAKVSGALRRLSNLPIHLVVNMHFKQIVVGDEDNKSIEREAKLKGDLKTTIYQEFDLIGFMETYYVPVGGERVRKHRVRWWPEPGYEMVRSRAVGADGVLLPQFTPVDFETSDFQVIFDSIATGAKDLTPSEVVQTLAVEGDVDGTDVPAPDEGAGPVAEPKLPPAKKTAAKKATAKKAAAPAEPAPEQPAAPAEPEVDPEAAGVEAASQIATPVEDPWTKGKGTAEEPIVLTDDEIDGLSSGAFAALDHVHNPEGLCMVNKVDAHPETVAPEKPAPAPAKPAGASQNCGDQPASLVGKFPATAGCGKALTPENRAGLAIVKCKTYLCSECFAAQSA